LSKKHFLFYDVLLPAACILILGNFLSGRFDGPVFRRLDSIRAFGLGFEFAHSALRASLLRYSPFIFALIPAAAWMVWVRINLEYDPARAARSLDRPVFRAFQAFLAWVEGRGAEPAERQAREARLAQARDRIRRLEAELAAARAESRPEWPEDEMPPARRQG
jgi:hypothetical protein